MKYKFNFLGCVGKQRQYQRKKWTKEEIAAVLEYFKNDLEKKILPGLDVCKIAIKKCPALRMRTSHHVKSFIHNYYIKVKKEQESPKEPKPPKDKSPMKSRSPGQNKSPRIGPVKKITWEEDEIKAINETFSKEIEEGTLPTPEACAELIKANPCLKGRSCYSVRIFIRNIFVKRDKKPIGPNEKLKNSGPKGPFKRKKWVQEEQDAVTEYFKEQIENNITPSLEQCNKCVVDNPVLNLRSGYHIRVFIRNLFVKKKKPPAEPRPPKPPKVKKEPKPKKSPKTEVKEFLDIKMEPSIMPDPATRQKMSQSNVYESYDYNNHHHSIPRPLAHDPHYHHDSRSPMLHNSSPRHYMHSPPHRPLPPHAPQYIHQQPPHSPMLHSPPHHAAWQDNIRQPWNHVQPLPPQPSPASSWHHQTSPISQYVPEVPYDQVMSPHPPATSIYDENHHMEQTYISDSSNSSIIQPQSSPIMPPQSSPVMQPQASPIIHQQANSPIMQPQASPIMQAHASPIIQPQASPIMQPPSSPVINSQASPVLHSQVNHSPVLQPHSSPLIHNHQTSPLMYNQANSYMTEHTVSSMQDHNMQLIHNSSSPMRQNPRSPLIKGSNSPLLQEQANSMMQPQVNSLMPDNNQMNIFKMENVEQYEIKPDLNIYNA